MSEFVIMSSHTLYTIHGIDRQSYYEQRHPLVVEIKPDGRAEFIRACRSHADALRVIKELEQAEESDLREHRYTIEQRK